MTVPRLGTKWNIKNFYGHDWDIMNPKTATLNEDFDNTYILEFPLMQWLIAAVHEVIDVEAIWVTRLSFFLLSIMTMIGYYLFLKEVSKDPLGSLLTSVAMFLSPLFYYYSINPMPDNFALCMAVWYWYYLFRYQQSHTNRDLIVSGIFISLAILTKLPFALFGVSSLILAIKYLCTKQFSLFENILLINSLALIAPLLWYARAFKSWGRNHLLTGMWDESISFSEVWRIVQFHMVGTFPFLLLTIGSLLLFAIGLYAMRYYLNSWKWSYSMMAGPGLMSIFYFFYEIKYIDIVHDYYLMPFIPIIYLIVYLGIRPLYEGSKRSQLILCLLMLSIPLTTYLTVQNRWTIDQSYFNSDVFDYKEELKAAVPEDVHCIFINDISDCIFSYQMGHWGYMFHNDDLPAPWIEDMIRRGGVKYMYSDSRAVDERPDIQAYIDTILLQRGSIKVIKLVDLE